MAPLPTLDAVHSRAAGALLDVLANQEIRPPEVFVRTERVADLLRAVCGKLGTRLTVRPSLPRAEEAFTSLLRFHGERRRSWMGRQLAAAPAATREIRV